MEAFSERLARITDLSPEELDALETELISAFDAADTDGDVDLMQELADALDQVRAAKASTGEEAPADMPAAEPVAASGDPVDAPADVPVAAPEDEVPEDAPAEQPAPAAAPEAPEVPADPANPEAPVVDGDPEVPAEDAPEAATAEGEDPDAPAPADGDTPEEEDTVAEITSDAVPEENRPDDDALQASAPAPVIRVGGDVPGFTAGAELADFDQAIEAITSKVNSMRGIGGDGEHVLVASIRFEDEVPEERTLRPGDGAGNSRKIREFLGDPEAMTPEALTAAGWCAPKAPIYDVPTVGTTDRPVRDALPTFNADRGGITWVAPPALPAFSGALGGWRYDSGEAVWESYDTPGGADAAVPETKNYLDVPCGAESSVSIEALTMSLCFDNMVTRAFPEWVRASTELTLVAQARWAEQFLLNKIWAGVAGNAVGTPDTILGAARDFLASMRITAAQFRWRNRLSRTQPLQLLVPSWLRDAIATDLLIQMPGEDKMDVADSEIAGYLASINVQPIWFIDDIPVGSGASTAVDSDSLFDSYLGYPTDAEWLMFPTGAFIRLDGGSLDLGIVRTKDDVLKNKYCEFSETFEGVAYMGPTLGANGWAVRGRTTVNIRGGFAPAVASLTNLFNE